jgi:hypothetical protein
MKVTRTSMLSGVTRTREIDVTADQLKAWHDGLLIQNAMPHLSADDREFLITGITPKEWDNEFLEDEP